MGSRPALRVRRAARSRSPRHRRRYCRDRGHRSRGARARAAYPSRAAGCPSAAIRAHGPARWESGRPPRGPARWTAGARTWPARFPHPDRKPESEHPSGGSPAYALHAAAANRVPPRRAVLLYGTRRCKRWPGGGRKPSGSGRRLRLHPDDLYAFGAHRGGINERWFSSTTNADNGPGTPVDEGLSYVRQNGQRFLLKAAVEQAGDLLLGAPVMAREKGWNLLCKFFDNMGPIPHHLHQSDEHAAKVGRRGKPEAYYFPPQYNPTDNNYPYTFMGLEPETRKEDVRRCLENWNKGDNGIMYLSRAYRLERGSSWQINPGILHALGSLLTYEPQVNSDVFAMFQSEVEGRIIPWDLLTKDVPPYKTRDLDYIIGMLDWDANVNPRFAASNRYVPKPVRPFAE